MPSSVSTFVIPDKGPLLRVLAVAVRDENRREPRVTVARGGEENFSSIATVESLREGRRPGRDWHSPQTVPARAIKDWHLRRNI